MTQNRETLPRDQVKSPDKQSKPLQDNAKPVIKLDGPQISYKHSEIVASFFNDKELNINSFQDVLHEKNHEERNVIHQIVLELKRRQQKTRQRQKTPPKAIKFIEDLVLAKPNLVAEPDEVNMVPLIKAAEHNEEIVFQVIDLVIPDSVLESISINCTESQHTCPLTKVHKSRLNRCLKSNGSPVSLDDIQPRERPARPGTQTTTPTEIGDMNAERTCLHDQIDIEKVEEQNAQLRTALSETLADIGGGPSCLEYLMVVDKFDPPAQKIPTIPLRSFKVLLQLCPDAVFENATKTGYSPLQIAIRLYDSESINYEHLYSVIQALVDRCPSSIYMQAGPNAGKNKDKTAYRLLKDLEEAKPESNAKARYRTEELLKRTCICSLQNNQDAITQFLYPDAKSVRQICLNLGGESVLLDKTYIMTIREESGMQFETVLSHVKLPYWNPQDRKLRDGDVLGGHRKGVDSDVVEASDPYTGVFEWLWDSGVRKIFTVEVDDDGPDSHTNAAIRQSLRHFIPQTETYRDFEIEVWNWKKFDLCSDTILNAAPAVKEVHLYSSGNTAILRSWACSSGLPKLSNLQRLEINIDARNKNDKEDCKRFEQEHLKKYLADECQLLEFEKISVHYKDRQAAEAGNHANDQENGPANDEKPSNIKPKSGEWIEELKAFKGFINGVLGPDEKPSVKVALLDDGTKLTALEGKQKGESFRPDNEAYFAGPSLHGTEMAQCIRRVCPMAELYIARLDHSDAKEQKFTTASVRKALKWAMDLEVDIISMSWTFGRKGADKDEDEREFNKLIENAVNSKKFILFGSLPDNHIAETSKYAPVGLEGVIKIGSATIFGEPSKENLYGSPDFLLPGEQIETQAGEIVRGSSFSTAYASGLAALVLCCLKAHKQLKDPKGILDPEDVRTRRLTKAKDGDGMATIFRNISSRSDADDKTKNERGFFVRPYITLKGKFEDSEEKKLKTIQRIANTMLPLDTLTNVD